MDFYIIDLLSNHFTFKFELSYVAEMGFHKKNKKYLCRPT